ncbi:hypothetical protein DFJ68_2681 [Terracoccus luteus]|uniref:DUF4145 domain-containing protein n=1 Tax=Terracoccus luteus TaxID=53356 RepID=A0A495XY53_9MICO|nr:hypothetical protein [Terracoccus luteus]RKT79217.1 hypothetical protein DFJ68_2681 [Terracoccus luteus]
MIWTDARRRVSGEDDLILLNECQLCYEAGAWRAAYVMAFLAAIEALEARLKQMAVGHTALGQGLAAALKSGSSKEAELIDLAAKHEFFTSNEKKRLHSIREMRNDYAHASHLSPQAYEVEIAVRTAIDLVLTREAQVLPGRAKALANELATDIHRLAPGEEAEKRFAKETAPVVHRTARAVMFRELLARHGDADAIAGSLASRVVRVARHLLDIWRPDLAGAEWHLGEILAESPGPLAEALLRPEVWLLVPVDFRSRVVGAAERSSEDLLDAIVALHRSGVDPESAQVFLKQIRSVRLKDWLSSSSSPLRELMPDVIDTLNGWNVADAKWTADRLTRIPASEFDRLDSAELTSLAQALEGAADPGGLDSWGVRADIPALLERTDLPPEFLLSLKDGWGRIKPKIPTEPTDGG